ncbi:hypothetical protein MCOR25_001307 [Pyricularia grisea]|nr:hypothetical protein MCOR25_001307 [Pyricularia grisea]
MTKKLLVDQYKNKENDVPEPRSSTEHLQQMVEQLDNTIFELIQPKPAEQLRILSDLINSGSDSLQCQDLIINFAKSKVNQTVVKATQSQAGPVLDDTSIAE